VAPLRRGNALDDGTARALGELAARPGEGDGRDGLALAAVHAGPDGAVHPAESDQAAARVAPAARAALEGQGEANPAFTRLRGAVEPLAENVSGVGLDVPTWVRRLEEALRGAKSREGRDVAWWEQFDTLVVAHCSVPWESVLGYDQSSDTAKR